jgi:hypothetical protein
MSPSGQDRSLNPVKLWSMDRLVARIGHQTTANRMPIIVLADSQHFGAALPP